MKEKLYNTIWRVGIQARDSVKQAGLLGLLEPIVLKWAPRLIRPPSTEVEVALPQGMKMVVPPGEPEARSLAAGLYEADLTHLFLRILREGMTVLDLGANVGYYTLLACKRVGASGNVYAFEPDPETCKYLLRNIRANGCLNATLAMRAVSNTTGIAYLVRDPTTYAKNWLSTSQPRSEHAVVQTVTLDDFFAQEGWPPVDLVKMDIEGGEKAALEGMRELSRRNPQMQLIIEYSQENLLRAGTSREAFVAVLQELGFRRGYIIEQGLKPFSLSEGLSKTHATYNLFLKKE